MNNSCKIKLIAKLVDLYNLFDVAQNALFHPPAAHIAAMSRPSHMWS